MKIGIVRRGFSATGGAEAYLLRLAGGLAAAGHDVELVTSGTWPAEQWKWGTLHRMAGGTPSGFAAAFRQVRDKFDISFSLERVPGCDIFRAGDGVHAAWLRRRAIFEPSWRSFFHRWNPKHGTLIALERQVFEQARHIVANSQMVAQEISDYYDFPKKRLSVIPNGLSMALPTIPKEEARARLGLAADIFCVLFVGTGWERKGLRTAIEAVESLDNALLLVAGRGNAKKHSAKNTKFLGPISDLSLIFSAADVFVLPTIYDPFSNACLEALAAGLPVVTTTGNGFSEIIEEDIHGNVVTPGDSQATAAALNTWRGAVGEEVAVSCRALASQYSLERNVKATIAVAEKVLAEKTA